MNRREFLQAGAGVAWHAPSADARGASRGDDLKRFRINKITGFRHVCPRPKLIGKNAVLGVHGRQTSENVLRIATDQGVEGVGVGTTKPETAHRLLGHTLADFGPGEVESALLDR